MGVQLTPIIVKQVLALRDLQGRSFAVDGNNVLYQFLALIRTRDGTPLMDSQGRVTSHLTGLVYRTTRLIADHGMRLVFVFDGKPPALKEAEIGVRRAARLKAEADRQRALAEGDAAAAWSKAVASASLTREMVQESKDLLDILGVPWVQAPSEGEAQAARMVREGHAWAVNSRDYDSLLFGAPRLLRYLTISGSEYLPSKGTSRPLKPELIVLQDFLDSLRLTREQLVDVAILVGTDFNPGVKGIGPVKAASLIRRVGSLENLPPDVRSSIPADVDGIRDVFLNPVTDPVPPPAYGRLDADALFAFLCDERGFSRSRVERVVERMRSAAEAPRQSSMDQFVQAGEEPERKL
jgi:flap endonuclease-1